MTHSSDGFEVTSVDVFLLRKALVKEMRISRGGFTVREHALVRLTTKSGHIGLGEGIGSASSIFEILHTVVAPRVLGYRVDRMNSWLVDWFQKPTYFEGLGSVASAVSAVEMAMWDAYGNSLGVSCNQLLGGVVQPKIPAYASDIYWQANVNDMRAEASRICSLGFTRVKAHIGVLPPREEAVRVQALREEIGSDVDLMLDLNCGYDLRSAREALSRWQAYQPYWIEEPLLPHYRSALFSLTSGSIGIPIALGENVFSVSDFAELAQSGGVDVLMPDAGRVGGIQALKSISEVGNALGRTVSPHNFSSGVLLAATAQVMSATSNMNLVEVDTSGNAIYEQLLEPDWSIADGQLTVSTAPGLGVRLPPEVLSDYCSKAKQLTT
jgi:L-alanine-DL-glutamate epimerase-like enolase superfamily enzyme